MKQWRRDAEAINKRRAEGSKEPRARVQMRNRVTIAKGTNWLLAGLMIHAGIIKPNGSAARTEQVPATEGAAKRFLRKLFLYRKFYGA
jgi:hypothetical protein